MNAKLLALLLCLLFAREASAQLVLVGSKTAVFGTGCCVGRDAQGRALVLTAAHCCSDDCEYNVIGQRERYPATVVVNSGMTPNRKDWITDVALLAATDNGSLPVQPLGTAVEVDEAVCINGCPEGVFRNLRQRTVKVISADTDSMTLSQPSVGGESGGPIINRQGQVVGVLSSTSKRGTLCTNITAIRRICGQHLGQPVKTLKSVELYHFSAPWCVPCQLMEPVVRKLKASGMPVKDINTDTDPQITKKMGVSAIPAFVVVKDGKPVDRIVGPSTEGMLRRMYERHAVVKADCARPEPEAPAPPTEEPPPVPVPDPISTPPAKPEGPPPAVPAECDCKALEAKIAELEASRKKLEAELAELKNTPPPPVVEPKPEKRVLYFTSIGNPNTAETDRAARKLKDNSYPITIITLNPKETNVRDVPRTHELPSGKSVIGASNVITYFAMLTKG